jgi:predicted RNase H-like HicB family nuclease
MPGAYNGDVHLSIELDREDDGRWIAEALEIPGVMTYGMTREEAISNTERLAIEVIADRIKHGELESPRSMFRSGCGVSNWPAGNARRVLAALERLGWRN